MAGGAVRAEAALRWRSADRVCAWEAAWFAATHRGDPNARSRVPARLYGLPVDEFVTLRAEALLRVEGRFEESSAAEARAERLLDACPSTGWTALNRALLKNCRESNLAALAEAVQDSSGVPVDEQQVPDDHVTH